MRALLLLTALSLSTAAIAQGPAWTPPNSDPKALQAGTYEVETEHTQVVFSVDHMGFTPYRGEFPGVTGTLVIDPKNPSAAKLDVTIPVDKVWVPNAKLIEELRDKMVLDSAKYPTMRFVSTKVAVTGANKADVTGNLTMHGVTKPVTLHVKFNAAAPVPMMKNAYVAGFEATGSLKRSEFGVGYGIPMVGDKVDLTIAGAFVKK